MTMLLIMSGTKNRNNDFSTVREETADCLMPANSKEEKRNIFFLLFSNETSISN